MLKQWGTAMNKLILFCLEKRVVVLGLALILIMGGFWYAPFNWGLGLKRDTIAVDAIPDLGENQQIIYTDWKGQSPEDIDVYSRCKNYSFELKLWLFDHLCDF
jgi:Cu/Ag efflux pump CusA